MWQMKFKIATDFLCQDYTQQMTVAGRSTDCCYCIAQERVLPQLVGHAALVDAPTAPPECDFNEELNELLVYRCSILFEVADIWAVEVHPTQQSKFFGL